MQVIPIIVLLSRALLLLTISFYFRAYSESRGILGLAGFLVFLSILGGLVFFIDYPDTPTADLHWEPKILEYFVEILFIFSPVILLSASACLIYVALKAERRLCLWLAAAYGVVVALSSI